MLGPRWGSKAVTAAHPEDPECEQRGSEGAARASAAPRGQDPGTRVPRDALAHHRREAPLAPRSDCLCNYRYLTQVPWKLRFNSPPGSQPRPAQKMGPLPEPSAKSVPGRPGNTWGLFSTSMRKSVL